MDHTHEVRHVHGRPVLASNSVLFVAAAAAGAEVQLDTFATHLVSHGCSIQSQSAQSVALYRFETFVAPLLTAAHTAVRRTGLAVSATMAVKVLVDGKHRPSPKSLDIGTTLAREASPGTLVLSLHLASLLQATEPECSPMLHSASLPTASGRARSVVRFEPTGSPPAAGAGDIGQVVGTLTPELAQRLAFRIYQRIDATAPGVPERVVREAVKSSHSATAITQALIRHVPPESHAAIRLIVDDEVRWIRVRGEPAAGSG
ncbi:MAG: hypothetical protein MUC86_02170 [Burkholderiaceae bacterium]|nr:hypothetical protein [Burkholderiaceae bacterium]